MSAPATPQQIPVNMWETSDAYVAVAPMPGVAPDDIEVRLDGGVLVMASSSRTPADKPYLLHEWHYGPYARTVELPGTGCAVEAVLGNGQLAVRVIKGEPNGSIVVRPSLAASSA